jgi:signal peptide peptidase SppA
MSIHRGGSVYGVAELADDIYRSRARKPIFAIANSLATSGAYWIASAASEFYVTPGGKVGGIGLHDMHTDLSKGLEKAGVETTLIAAGKYKTESNSFQPLGVDARPAMQKRIDGYYRQFVAAVAKHRAVPESAARNGMGEGRLLDAERAKREGMVVDTATIDEVVRKLAQRID